MIMQLVFDVASVVVEALVVAFVVVILDEGPDLTGRSVLVIEDGPTLTHGGMTYGAGWYAAQQAGAAEVVDPVPHAVGSIRETYEKYPNARRILPAMG